MIMSFTDQDDHRDEFMFISTDELLTNPSLPLPVYPDVDPADTPIDDGRNPDITPWTVQTEPVGILSSSCAPTHASP